MISLPDPKYRFRRFSFRDRGMLAVVLAVSALVAFGAWVIDEKRMEYRRSTELLAAGSLIRAVQEVAIELQAERGLAALRTHYRRRSGQPPVVLELDQQRRETDARLHELGLVTAGSSVAAPVRDIRPATIWAEIARIREDSDQGEDVIGVLEGYGALIKALMRGASVVTDGEGTNLIASYIDLGHIIDRLASERAVGAAILAGVSHRRLDELFLIAHVERSAFIDSFLGHSSAEQAKMLNAVLQGPLSTKVEGMHEAFRAGRLGAGDSALWYSLHAQLLDEYAQVDQRLAAHLQETIANRHLAAQNTFYLVLGGVIALVLVSLETLRRSERRAARAEGEARTLFRAVEQSPLAVMITDPDGIIEYTNPAFSRITGYGRDEVVGHNPRFLKPDEGSQADYALLWQTIRAGNEWRGEVRNRRKDGSLYWESMTISPVKDIEGRVVNFIAIKEDVSEVKSLRTALEREHANIRLILDSLRDGIALIDQDGGIEYANRSLREEFGAIDGRNCMEYFGETPETCPPRLESEGESLSPREWCSTVNGRTYEVSSALMPTADGRPATLEVFHDVSARRQAEMAMIEAREAAELANRAKSEFLSTMSHELRTPLNAIIGFSEIISGELLGPVGQPSYVDYAGDIHTAGRNLLQLINDILDVSRLEVGRLALSEEVLEVGALIESGVAIVRGRADDGGVVLAPVVADDMPRLWGDERRIKQMLVSVIGNAVKFTPAGGRVTVGAVNDGQGGIVITIADTGIGIAPEVIDKVLQPFGQADSGMARRYEGSGLGLPLAKRLIELHGGTLSLESNLGRGTTVTLRFPPERSR